MSTQTQEKYEVSLKHQVAHQVLNEGQRQCDVASQYGLRSQLISRWVREYQQGTHWARSEAKVAEDEEVRRLQRENTRLQQEVEILKKASAYFAKHLR